MKRFRHVAVLKGGMSAERDVSLRSGTAVARGLRTAGYKVTELDIETPEFDLPAGCDVVFIMLHGEFGEDGTVQEILERRGIPYTGSGPDSCRLAFDKGRSRAALAAQGIPIPAGTILTRPSDVSPLPLPVVVKPTRQGSSLGCHRVATAEQWSTAVCDALSYHGEAVVEEFIPGRELTVGFVGAHQLPPIEIRAPGGCYDYHAKYTPGVSDYLCPAPLSRADTRQVCEIAAAVVRALGAEGMGRVDLRLTPESRACVLELNSIPGFTETSLLPMAAAAAGIDFPSLCDRILNLARGA